MRAIRDQRAPLLQIRCCKKELKIAAAVYKEHRPETLEDIGFAPVGLDGSYRVFISEDPVGFNGGSINLYEYVGNNPVNAVDPLGLTKSDPWYGYNDKDFQWWFHKCGCKGKFGPRVRSEEEIAECYAEWVSRGQPRNHKCWKKEEKCEDKRGFFEKLRDAWNNVNDWIQEHYPQPDKGPRPGVPPGPFLGPGFVPVP
jgi:hypothetical protein